jgi:hypothetical protein
LLYLDTGGLSPAGKRAKVRAVKSSIRRVLTALLVFHAIGRVASAQDVIMPSGVVTTRLRVDVVFDGPPMPPRVEASAIEEITLIWAPYGVDVFMSNLPDAGWNSDVTLVATLADRPNRRNSSQVLGSILFRDGQPQPAITMYQHAIDALVSTVTVVGTNELQWPTAFRDAIVGRVLGRGLAHEIGHFLLRSRQHSEAGLMRAPHRAPDLAAVDRRPFTLSADEQMRLVSMTSTSFRLSARAAGQVGVHSR